MTLFAPTDSAETSLLRERGEIDDRYKWRLESIFPDWTEWSTAYDELGRHIDQFATLRGSLARGGAHLLAALELRDVIGQLSYKVWYFASLWYDQDQRDNDVNARRQQVQILFAKAAQASSWFDPELLAIPLATVQAWLAESLSLAVYRFAVEDLYRQQEHVLDESGERLLSFSSRFASAPTDAYSSLTTADMKPPTITLPSGGSVTLTYGQYRGLLSTNRRRAYTRGLNCGSVCSATPRGPIVCGNVFCQGVTSWSANCEASSLRRSSCGKAVHDTFEPAMK